jgi:hypothetical protein
MNAFIKFNKGILKMPICVRLWLILLLAVNMFMPLFFLDRVEAWAVLAALLASMMLMTILTAYAGFTRLLGLGHIFWFPLLYFLWNRLDRIPTDHFYGIWVRALMAFNAASLIIDSIDVFRYINGRREEIIKGL